VLISIAWSCLLPFRYLYKICIETTIVHETENKCGVGGDNWQMVRRIDLAVPAGKGLVHILDGGR
jgi:hypothetical protein